jgi:hypothetical protein
MNVLILTPDAVGSTLLQRLITIYMQFHDFDKPVINLHELTNGLEKYYSPEFGREIVSKSRVKNWSYYQSLEEVVQILSEVDHYKTSRLAQYHIKNRNDPINQQIPFYRYLDENFFVIACRRHNIFEHALSMTINSITKRLNVYSHQEKINAFLDMYLNPIDIDQKVLFQNLESYRQYLSWSQNHFNIGSYFDYDQHTDDIERYILNLPFFSNQHKKITWQEKFDISLNDWNLYHWIPSDIGRLSNDDIKSMQVLKQIDKQNTPLTLYQKFAPSDWPSVYQEDDLNNLPDQIKQKFHVILGQNTKKTELPLNLHTSGIREFLQNKKTGYINAQSAIDRMQQLDILVSPPPIKKQTLQDKMRMIKNQQQCIDTYNNWAENHSDIAESITFDKINTQVQQENQFWRNPQLPCVQGHDLPTIVRLEYQNGDNL